MVEVMGQDAEGFVTSPKAAADGWQTFGPEGPPLFAHLLISIDNTKDHK